MSGSAADEFQGKAIPDLEGELRQLISTSRMPPSATRQLFESYAMHTQLADAAQRENAQRTFLASTIVAYRNRAMQLSPLECAPEADLMRLALAMSIKADSYLGDDLSKRLSTLRNMLSEYERETYAAEDREFCRRLALAAVIQDNAADSAIQESDDPAKTIENLQDDELCCPRCGAIDVENHHTSQQSGNSADWVTFTCRKCGNSSDSMDGDQLALYSPWARKQE